MVHDCTVQITTADAICIQFPVRLDPSSLLSPEFPGNDSCSRTRSASRDASWSMFRGRLRKLYQYESVHIHDTSSLYTRSAVFTQKKHKGELCIPQKPIGNQVPCVELCEYESARVRKCKDRSKMLKFINTNISHCSVAMRLEILVLTADTSFLCYTAAN